jgi:hypothetical protein
VAAMHVSSKSARNLLVFALTIVAGYGTANWILQGNYINLVYVALLAVMGIASVAILRNWRNGIYFFLMWLLFEDLARKFLGNNMAIYFAKDLLLLIVYLSFFIAYRQNNQSVQRFRPPFLVPLLCLVWFGAVQIFNPSSTHIFFGLLGMKVYFYYVPLLAIGYALIDSEADLRRFFHINLGFMLVIIALGIVQSILGHTFLNPAVPAEDIRLLSQTYREAPISGVKIYRPTSVFVSVGRFQDLVMVAWMLVFGFSGYLLLRRRRGRVFAFLALSLTAAGCVMASSRGVFMWTAGSTIVGAVAFIWGAPWRQGEALRALRNLQRVAIGIALAVVLLMVTYPQAFLDRLAVFSETLDPRSPASELVNRSRDYPLRNFLAAFSYQDWPYGYGIGTVSLGSQYVSRIFHTTPPVVGVESGFGALVVEMGIGGLILWLVTATAILLSAWRVVLNLKGTPWFPLAFMIFWYAFLLLGPFTFEGLQAYQDFILNAYMWLLLGVLFRLPKLAFSAQFAPEPTLSPSPWVR